MGTTANAIASMSPVDAFKDCEELIAQTFTEAFNKFGHSVETIDGGFLFKGDASGYIGGSSYIYYRSYKCTWKNGAVSDFDLK